MIFEPQKYLFIWHDALYSLGVGFLCGFFNRLLSSFLYRGKVRVFIRDVLSCLFFALMLFSYTVSFANYRVLRWYNVAFAFAGAVMFIPAFDRAVQLFFSLFNVTVKYRTAAVYRTIQGKLSEHKRKQTEKHQKFTQKSEPEALKDNDKVLYN